MRRRVNRYPIWFYLFFQRERLNKCVPERYEAETDTDEENDFKSIKSLAKTEYKPRPLEDVVDS